MTAPHIVDDGHVDVFVENATVAPDRRDVNAECHVDEPLVNPPHRAATTSTSVTTSTTVSSSDARLEIHDRYSM